MIIGVDLDEVLAALMPQLIEYHNYLYKTSYVFDDFKSFYLWKTWGGTRKETDKKIWNFYDSELFDDTLPIEGAREGIEVLAKRHKLAIITSRPQEIKGKTQKWLRKYFPDKFSAVHFAYNFSHGKGKSKKKLAICKDLGVEVLIEDCLENVMDIENVSSKTKVILLDRPWNRSRLPKNVTRVFSWKEIINKLNE